MRDLRLPGDTDYSRGWKWVAACSLVIGVAGLALGLWSMTRHIPVDLAQKLERAEQSVAIAKQAANDAKAGNQKAKLAEEAAVKAARDVETSKSMVYRAEQSAAAAEQAANDAKAGHQKANLAEEAAIKAAREVENAKSMVYRAALPFKGDQLAKTFADAVVTEVQFTDPKVLILPSGNDLVEFSDNGRWLLGVGSGDADVTVIEVWDILTAKPYTYKVPKGQLSSAKVVAFARGQSDLLYLARRSDEEVFDLNLLSSGIWENPEEKENREPQVLKIDWGAPPDVTPQRLAANSRFVVVAWSDAKLRVWDRSKSVLLPPISLARVPDILTAAPVPGGLAWGYESKAFYLNLTEKDAVARVIEFGGKDIATLAFSEDGSMLSIGERSGGVWIAKTKDSEAAERIPTETDAQGLVRTLRFCRTPFGDEMLAVVRANKLVFYDPLTGYKLATVEQPPPETKLRAVGYIVDQQMLAIVDDGLRLVVRKPKTPLTVVPSKGNQK